MVASPDGGLFGLTSVELRLTTSFIGFMTGVVIAGTQEHPTAGSIWGAGLAGAGIGFLATRGIGGFITILNGAGKVGQTVFQATMLNSINPPINTENVGKQTIDNITQQSETNSYVQQWAIYKPDQFPSFKTLLSNYPLPYNIRPDRTPINPQLPLDDETGYNFLYFNQCAIRVSIALRRSGVSLGGAKNITKPGHSPYANGNILGATNLAGFLLKFGTPELYNGTKMNVASKLKNRTGIIYFQSYNENYGTNRPPERNSSNVHIDLWNKNRIMAPYLGQMLDAIKILF